MDRTVASMTTEQLYRKRAFDRINQRESRARRKGRIATLEEEVADLRRQLAHAQAQIKSLQSSDAVLRKAIDSARNSLQVLDTAASADTPIIPTPSSPNLANDSLAKTSSYTLDEAQSPSISLASEPSHGSALDPSSGSFSSDIPALALRDENTGLTLGLPLGESPPLDGMFHFWGDGSASDMTALNAFSLTFLDSFPADAPGDSWITPFPDPSADIQLLSPGEPQDVPQWKRLPLHIDATCRLDTVLLDLFHSSRQQVQDSSAIAELSGPAFPSIGSLLNPEIQNSQSPISSAIGQHGRITMNVPSLPVKLGMMYNMCVLLRWLISPTKRNYEALPEYLKPIESQLTTPHPIWVDVVVWPEARERLIQSMDWSDFPDFRMVCNLTISINWPYPQSNAFTAALPTELKLNPIFENHIRHMPNWTWGREVGQRFPFLSEIPTHPEKT